MSLRFPRRAASASLILVVAASAATVHMNQAVFDLDAPKAAIVEGDASLAGKSFAVESGGKTAYSGKLGQFLSVEGWSSQGYCVARFDSLSKAGTYTLVVGAGEAVSGSFVVGADALRDATLPRILDYFTSSRQSGQAANTGSRATSGDTKVKKYGDASGTTWDVHGGWHDATGDVSKYLSHLSYANYANPQQIPLTAWTLAFTLEKIPAWLKTKGLDGKVRQEALWGADFLVRMQDPAGYFYTNVFDGWDTAKTKEICAFSTSAGTKSDKYQAAWREGGGMAIAALAAVSTWKVAGDYPASRYLAAAETGYAHLKSKTVGGVCAYCDDGVENILDDYAALMAASELYRATKTSTYLDDARARAERLVARQTPRGSFWSDDAKTRPFWHASDAGLPLVALVRYLEQDSAASPAIREAIGAHLRYLLEVSSGVPNPFGLARQTWSSTGGTKDAFFMPHTNETGYWWQGENARLASLSAAAWYAGRVSLGNATLPLGVPDSLSRFAQAQIDWILGANPKDLSFFQGVGRNAAEGYFTRTNGHFAGGIVNGITSCDASRSGCVEGTGIDYRTGSEFPANPPAYTIGPWFAWRWTEQWLPHSTWFLAALAARYDEVRLLQPSTIGPRVAHRAAPRWTARFEGNSLRVEWAEPTGSASSVEVLDLGGRRLASAGMERGNTVARLELDARSRGVFVVRSGEASIRLFR